MQAADLLNALVSDVLAGGERAARVCLERRMGCVGCPFSPFETVAEVAAIYGVNALELADALLKAGVTVKHSGGEIS